MKNIILHYHLFKNAGSSIDKILENSFEEKWRSYDNSNPSQILTTTTITALIDNLSEITAWSSHQIVPPIPTIKNVNIFSYCFHKTSN